jgi:branched-chain amino acid transport system substrate-binding protein
MVPRSMMGRRVIGPASLLACSAAVLLGLSLGSAAAGTHDAKPIVIGASISQTGDFSADGAAVKRGYDLWAATVNAHGGLLGRKVVMKYANDASSTQQVVTNYRNLISQDHVDLVFGPFSSLLTIPSSEIASRFGYAFVEPAGGSQDVFNRGLTNVFEAEPQAGFQDLEVFGHWILSLPKNSRPKTAAYAAENDPFLAPEVADLKAMFEKAGIKTVYNKVFPLELPDYSPLALAISHTKADVVALGVNVPDGTAFTKSFVQQHYNPKAIVYTNGPDQGTTWVKAVGAQNLAGQTGPVGWIPSLSHPGNKAFVKAYLRKYGGAAAGMSDDSAEAFSVGQVMQQAIESAKTIDNKALIATLHKLTFKTVQGTIKFAKNGEPQGTLALGQWTQGNWTLVYPPGQALAKPVYPKPAWGSSH